MLPGPVPSMGRNREQHNSHKRGTREKHNSYKWQNVETKCRPATTKQIPRNGDQTLKLHHVRTPTLSKRGRRWERSITQTIEERRLFIKKPGTPRKPCSLFQLSINLHYNRARFPKGRKTKEPHSSVQDPNSSDIKEPHSSD